MWDELVGQDVAIERFRVAARRPSHAYLVVGPAGSGARSAARSFAAALIGGEADDDVADRVLRGVHPDVIEFEPGATQYSIRADIRERVIPEALRAPVEAPRKVLVLHEAERLRGNQNESANALLKTLEEPPPRTVLVLVTALVDDLLPTIRSRCQRIDLERIDASLLVDTLVSAGVAEPDAQLAVGLSGGELTRAQALAGPLARLRAAFVSMAARVDGTGATAYALAAEANAAVDDAAEHVRERHEAELEELDERLDREGYEGRDAKRQRVRVEERQKRELRRTRMDLLLEGVTALETMYRDVLAAPGDPLNTDRERLAVGTDAADEALMLCREARDAFLLNEKGTLRLEHLAISLPVPALA